MEMIYRLLIGCYILADVALLDYFQVEKHRIRCLKLRTQYFEFHLPVVVFFYLYNWIY